MHPARSWRELVANTTTLYEQARQSRLGTEKFMLDGRHTGTGGGNHVVLGGSTPADSPFLRRPDLLKSFVGYWLNHPSLSYLFSGVFIGPTSQAPRVDETRADAVYELEIALRPAAERAEARRPPWLVDRIFRNLLVDVTGNTHRAEFCIDKLYSPDSATGRLGLVEMRAFEMPPHARMSLAQQLLVRTLLAWFWRAAVRRRADPLGHAAARSLPAAATSSSGTSASVIDDLHRAGYPDRRARGSRRTSSSASRSTAASIYDGVEVELRQAIEPWYVLGEEPGAGGTARYVDSSVERLQVQRARARCPSASRSRATACSCRCSRPAPHGEFVCGVRYRAWQPPRCLHPTIPVHTPLVFDVVDLAARRADRRLHLPRRPSRAGGTTRPFL